MAGISRQLHPSVGIELGQIDATASGSSGHIRLAAHMHACVLLREQTLSPADLERLAHALGIPLPPYRPQYSVPGHETIVRIGNVVRDGKVSTYLNRGGIEWHTDSPGSAHPPGYSLLYCVESDMPDGGGETGFLSTVSGYTALPADLKDRLSGLTLVHSFNTFNDQVAGYAGSDVLAQSGELRERNADTHDPVVQTHPSTAARHLYFSHAMIQDIPALGLDEGMKLIMAVHDVITADDLVYKHKWAPGDLIVFDNRICLHTPYPYAFDDYPRTRRLLHQIIVGGRT